MKIEEETLNVFGERLHHLVLHPESSPRGGLVFFHGQGDFIDRYPGILKPFVDAGLKCLLTELPGHGRSPGKRGHIPHVGFVDQILDSSLEKIEGPVTIAGHSMGGLMALRLLITHPGLFKNAWISSPLLDPMNQAKPWMRAILPHLTPILPRVTVSTGVTSKDCRDDSAQSEPSSTQLYHSRVSLIWGRTLSLIAEEVNEKFTQLPSATRLIFTQGKDDRICPPQFLRERLLKVTHPAITYEEIPGARHEPFGDPTGNELAKIITLWLAQTASIV